MSLIPFILDLAEELHDFNRSLAMDIDDLGFGMYPLEHQVQAQAQTQTHSHPYAPQLSRPALRLGLGSSPTTSSSVLWVPIKGQHAASPAPQHRHHPYNRVAGAKTVCCNKSLLELEKELGEKGSGSGAGGTTATSPATASKSAYSVVNRNGFQVSMNVKQFSARELTVRTIDNCIVVEGQHDEKEDGHGVISRHFIRKYMLPKGFDPAEVHSTLSSDGILTVKAPPPPPPASKAGVERLERIVDIQQLLQSQLQPKDAQTPKPVPTEANAQAEAESKSVAAPTPTAGAAAAVAATPESNGNGQAEAVASAADVNVDADIAVPAEAAAKAVETTSTTCTSTTTSNSSANNGVKLESESESMEVATTAEASTPKEDSTPNPTAPVVSSSEEEAKTEPNANDVAVSSNNGSSGNGNGNSDVAPVVGEDEDMPMSAKVVGEEKQQVKEPEKGEKSSKGAEELAAVDAAILLAKNQPLADGGENGAAAVGVENGASAGGENGAAAAAKTEEVAAK